MTDPIQHLRELMAKHRSAVITRQMSEDDDPQRYEDACDMEDEAEEELKEAIRNLAPQLLEVVEAAREQKAAQSALEATDFDVMLATQSAQANLAWTRLKKAEQDFDKALAALGGKGEG